MLGLPPSGAHRNPDGQHRDANSSSWTRPSTPGHHQRSHAGRPQPRPTQVARRTPGRSSHALGSTAGAPRVVCRLATASSNRLSGRTSAVLRRLRPSGGDPELHRRQRAAVQRMHRPTPGRALLAMRASATGLHPGCRPRGDLQPVLRQGPRPLGAVQQLREPSQM